MIETRNLPLVVDLDGTLTPTDTLAESLIKVLQSSPLSLLNLVLWLVKGRAAFKKNIASHSKIAVELLPYRKPLLDYLHEEKQKGRQIILATAAHHSIAENVARHLGLFDQVLATKANCNLKGSAKLQAIREKIGDDFVYAGDSQADLPIWDAARAAILVDVSANTAKRVRQKVLIEREFHETGTGLSVWSRALRIHQWLKNLLLFVPSLTAFSFQDITNLITMVVAFLAFSFAASAAYIINDLLDLENDRIHPRKRLRPFASAQLPIFGGVIVATISLFIGLILAFTVSKNFFLMLMLYLVLNSLYNLILKKYVLIDVLMLSFLYTLRILAGSVAINILTSSWLLAFSTFIFLSLALVKRCAELVSLEQKGCEATSGRDYRITDQVVLWPLGVGTALSAVVVFGLFIMSPETQSRYGTSQVLWLVAFGLVYWLARLWVKTSRGEMHDDPVIYAIKDHGSLTTVVAMVLFMLLAYFLPLDTYHP